MGDRRSSVSVVLKSADGAYTTAGQDVSRGIVPEGLSVSANESGPDTCSFTLRRRASLPWPDLLAFNECDVHVGGRKVWGGRIWEAPVSDTDDDAIVVQGRGWQYHLDDDLLDEFWVHTDLKAFRSQRSYASADLASFLAAGEPSSTDGVPVIGWPNDTFIPNASASGVTFDFGPNRVPKRVVVEWGSINGNAFAQLYVRSHSGENPLTGSTSDAISVGFETIAALPALTTSAGTFGTGYRYLSIFLFRDDGSSTTSSFEHLVRVNSIKVFAQTRDESGNASILKASDVVKDVLASGALPLLNASTAGIDATSFSIPELAGGGYQTPRQIITSANVYEGNLFGVDVEKRVFYREAATNPRVEVGAWSGADFQDASTNSAETLYNQVIVQGVGPDGAPISETRTATSTLLDRQGFTRTATLQVGSPLTVTAAQQIGDLWLAEKASPPLKGTLVVKRHGAARNLAGSGMHPSELLLMVGERIRLGIVDPGTGAWGRDGTIKSVSYSHDAETATVELDNERGRLEALLQRLAVVTTQVLR